MPRLEPETHIAEKVSGALKDQERVDAALSGGFAVLPQGGYETQAGGSIVGGAAVASVGSATDPYDIVLTTERLLAFSGLAGSASSPRFACDRASGHVTVVRRLAGWAWVSVVFHDRELRLLVGRRFREQLARMADALH